MHGARLDRGRSGDGHPLGDQRKAAGRALDDTRPEREAAVETRSARRPAGRQLAVGEEGPEAGGVEPPRELRGELLDAQHVDVVLAHQVDERPRLALAELHVGGEHPQRRSGAALGLGRAAEGPGKDGADEDRGGGQRQRRRGPVAQHQGDRDREERGQGDVRGEREQRDERQPRVQPEQPDQGPQGPEAGQQPADEARDPVSRQGRNLHGRMAAQAIGYCESVMEGTQAVSPRSSEAGAPDAGERILDAAYDLFCTRGVHIVGIDEIIATSDVARQTLYRRFRSKQDLVLAVLARREQLWLRGWLQAEVERRAADPDERLLTIFEVFDEWFHRPRLRGLRVHQRDARTPGRG